MRQIKVLLGSAGNNMPFGESKAEFVMRKLAEYLSDETGATAIEYGLIAAGIAGGSLAW